MKVTIECSEQEAHLIERALELYSRAALCQFDNLTLCNSLQKEIWKFQNGHEFRDKSDELKKLFGLHESSYWGIFNTEHVHDDARIAADLQQTMRHERYKNRMATGEQAERHYTVDEHPADICKIAGMTLPDFKMIIE